MKEIRILSLELKNFQGHKDLKIDFNGKDYIIEGENEAGKTTIKSAWNWLLFDKNAIEQSTQKFDIKPLDEDNNPIHRLDTVVKATLDVDGSQLTLKKKYYEVWQTKRGYSEEVLTGHTTDCYISGVPKKKTEYDAQIAGLADENIFKLLTDPLYFNTQLHWKKRRDVLLQLENVTDEDVFEANDKLQDIRKTLENRTVDEHKKVLKSQIDELQDDIDEIPVRIDETHGNLPDIKGINVEEVKKDIKRLKGAKAEREKELAKIENGSEIAEKEKELAKKQTELMKIEQEHRKGYDEKISVKKKELSSKKDKLSDIVRDIKNRITDISDKREDIEDLQLDKEDLKKDWWNLEKKKDELKDQKFNESQFELVECPDCGNEFPLADVEKHRKKFNREKAEKIEKWTEKQKDITEKGQAKNTEIDKIEQEIENIKTDINVLEKKKAKYEACIADLKIEIEQLEEKADEYQEEFYYKKTFAECQAIQNTIDKIEDGDKEVTDDIKDTITKLEAEIGQLEKKLSDVEQYEKGQKRIQELKAELKGLNKKKVALEREMYLCERFEKTRSELLEEKVNGLFKMAKFKLFEKQLNGGYKDTCQTLYKGVPYETGLNSGHQILVGLDIINVLSKHFKFRAPIFVDNAETVTSKIESESQLIQLKAVEGQKELNFKETS